MQYTEEQERHLIDQFAVRRKRQLAALIPVVAALVLLFVAEDRSEPLLGLPAANWGPIGFGIIVLVLGFSIVNWRCPACSKYLGRSFGPRFCPRCGVRLVAGE